MKISWIAGFVCFALATVLIHAEPPDLAAPNSKAATAAMSSFAEVQRKAASQFEEAEGAARKQYVAELHRALEAALKSANLAAANWAKSELDSVQGGAAPSLEKPQGEAASAAAIKYGRTVDKAATEAGKLLDAARSRCIESLEAAQRNAMTTLRDVAEANRISAQISIIKTQNFSIGRHKINLLNLIDCAIDGVEGKWRLLKGELVAAEGRTEEDRRKTIEFPITPPAEYDFSVTYRYVTGTESYTQTCYANEHQFNWVVGAAGNQVCLIPDFADAQRATVKADHWLNNGQAHTSLVKVRKAEVQCFLDGKLIVNYKTDYHDVHTIPLSLTHHDTLGFGFRGEPGLIVEAAYLAEVTGKSKLTRAAPSTSGKPGAHQESVNLLPLIDVNRDGLRGRWQATRDGVSSDETRCALLRIPYHLPDEYDLCIDYTRMSGSEWVDVILSHGEHGFVCGIAGNGTTGIERIDGRGLGDSVSTKHIDPVVNGKPHRLLIQVRAHSVVTFFDGIRASEHTSDFSDMIVPGEWNIGKDGIGIGSLLTPTVFHQIRIVEISGKGNVIARPN